jgi:copper(I)-binding protein
MKKYITLGLLAISAAVSAQTTVKVEDAWVRGTVAAQKATGAFMRLTASANARLVAAESPVAGVTEIHEMAMDNNVMKMRAIQGLDLAAGRVTELKPGGYHVMLMDLKQPVQAGQSVPITLVFEEAGKRFTQTVQAPVKPMNAGAAPAGATHQHGGMKHTH